MTPQEKAKELLDKMTTNTNNETLMYKNKFAKECALIAVDEIIDYLISNKITGTLMTYWQEIKQEIEKL
jgi:hypothetical protein